ncbi:hypothetical protein BJ138DRAFT_672302 [Hygrophoropsis aurantiaca]|uniref:Uncharacterized protein n=1 Tax=Hygrophoropsis aurantiaca TaxID=72124 RepID=A0ACB7ZY76_9AGAM|nr:hypothetical protein BJ138DRAFT_672302 [Hygrophoropsis aurantiaca]
MADPALIQDLQGRQIINYVAAAAGALVAYDQVLTFSQEVDHIWNRQWSFMTVLYLVARYSGSLSMIGAAAWYMRINWTYSVIVNIYLAIIWAESIFVLTMQAILAIRVYVLFSRSKNILIFLAVLYLVQATATFVITALLFSYQKMYEYVAPFGPAIGSVAQTTSFNLTASIYWPLSPDITIISAIFDAFVFFFALWAFIKHTLEAKRLEGRWSVNVLVGRLMADHLAYFICNLTWLLLSLAASYVNEFPVSDARYILSAFAVISGPRMIISLREQESKTRGLEGTSMGEMSTIQFGIREPPTHSECC